MKNRVIWTLLVVVGWWPWWVSGALPSYVTPDGEFRGVEPPGWVLDGVVKVFLPLEDAGAMEEAAGAGATVVHAGGPSVYFPLRRDRAESGVPEPERGRMLAGIARAKWEDEVRKKLDSSMAALESQTAGSGPGKLDADTLKAVREQVYGLIG